MISTSFFASLSSEETRPSVLSFLVVPNDGRQQIWNGAVIIICELGVRGARGAGDRLLTLWFATIPPKMAKSTSQLTQHSPKMERIVQKTAQTALHYTS
jgi:hypothetical protein